MRHDHENVLDIAFIIAMFILLSCFLICFILNPTGHQADVFFSRTRDFFADYLNVHNMAVNRNPYWFGLVDPRPAEHGYPPLCYALFYLFARFDWGAEQTIVGHTLSGVGYSAMELAIACVIISITSILFFLLLREGYRKKGAVGLLLPAAFIGSSAFLFALERGNIIILAADFTMFFLLAYRSENRVVREAALISLALATALKGYPALMGMLLLFDRRFAAAVRAALYALLLIFAPFLLFTGGFGNIHLWIQNIQANSRAYRMVGARFGFRALPFLFGNTIPSAMLDTVFSSIDKLFCVVALCTCFFQKQYWKRVLLLALALICVQTNNGEYLGLYLFLPIVYFFDAEHTSREDIAYLVAFILILNPFQIIISGRYTLNLTILLAGVATVFLYVQLTGEAVMAFFSRFGNRHPKSRKSLS